ncbi:DNA-binding transcriptional repressor XynR [Rugosimonospora acidiphila]|uniref:DNA-binding transcriptional repressor XynR n=1 Tax=Rugosimonospora acidiphila TaxID=556531 RepID=A0ABP9RR41_9ACTN
MPRSSNTREVGGGTQSVERALSLLRAFTEEHPERRVSELVQLTGLGQSTVSRLIGTLEILGFVTHDSHSGLYRIGPTVVGLAGIALNQSPIHLQSRQIAQDLAGELNLGANVAERQGPELFYLCNFEGRSAPRSFTLIGRRGPLHATAMGKALLTDMAAEDIEGLIGARYPTYTPKTILDIDNLLASLAEGRERGYTTELEELAFGRACLAAPVRDRSGRIVASLSVSGPLSAMDLPRRQDELAMKVIEQADRVSSGLGYHAAVPSAIAGG